MRIERLTLENYRRFESLSLDFQPGMNVIAGLNGSGKTSVFDALSAVCGHALSDFGYRTENDLSPTDLRVTPIETPSEFRWVDAESGAVTGDFQLTSHHRRQISFVWLRGLWVATQSMPPLRADVWPVLLALPAQGRWPRVTVHSADASILTGSNVDPKHRFSAVPNDGASSWLNWIARQELISLQEGSETPALAAMKEALARALPDHPAVRYRFKERELIISNGVGPRRFGMLSEGQRSLMTIVAELAMRCIDLNDHLGETSVADTPGVCLIDELDLHLHPLWQRQIVRRLPEVFPKIQFITTTHSPQIIGEVEASRVILLGAEGVEQPSQAAGMDSNWILRHILGAPERGEEVRKTLDDIDVLLVKRAFDSAREEIARLRREVGDFPDLQRLATKLEGLRRISA